MLLAVALYDLYLDHDAELAVILEMSLDDRQVPVAKGNYVAARA